jgi:hypothetical protein
MSRMRFGTHRALEDAADALIKESLKGVFSHKEKSDILTPWKAADRLRREVYTNVGVPDAAVRKGMFHRVANRTRPDLNSRDGLARSNRISSSLTTHIEEHGYINSD